MFCDRCGTQLADPANYCPACGKAAGITPFMPIHSRIAGHVRLLGIFWIALSAFHLIPGLVLLSFSGHGSWFLPPEVPGFVHGILGVVAWILLGSSILGLAAGWGLLQREPWARTLAIVMACLSLINMPLGTALGIYTLWVLLPAASEQEYRSVARAA
ncbi:MAG TPA: zinc ribbon domain-containing protein [Bryobacteraceae bacterium]|nr:zinc ribbon domain-containing protein [Bryobacteraceae bacterium]